MKATMVRLAGQVTAIAPLGVVVGLNWSEYTSTVPKTISLTLGGMILALVLALNYFGKLKSVLGSGYTTLVFCALLCTFMQPIIADLEVILYSLLAGETVNKAVFKNWAKKLVESKTDAEQQKKTEEAMSKVFEQWRGRV